MLGRCVYEFEASAENTRNSEGAFITTNEGHVLFIYSRFMNESHDDSSAELYGILSTDRGQTFGKPRPVLLQKDEQAKNIMSVSLLRMRNDDIGMFYLVRRGEKELYCYMRRSSDEGKTFGESVCCTPYEPGFWIVNNDRVIRLHSGRLLIPAASHRMIRNAERARAYRLDPHGEVFFFYSDDDGDHWEISGNRLTMAYPSSRTGLQEPGVIELSPGLIWCYMRTDTGRYYEAFSHDEGVCWTTAQMSRFSGPESPLCVKRIGKDELLAVWNPIPLFNGRSAYVHDVWTGKRTPLVASVGKDNGRSFGPPLLIEDDPDCGYCYTAIHPLEDAILLAYCAGSWKDGSCLNRMRIRRIARDELLGAEPFLGS